MKLLLLLGTFIAVCFLGRVVLLGIVWGVDALVYWIQQVFIVCPHCHQELKRVYYKCPDCNRVYMNLYPNQLHIFHLRCSCGRKLTTIRLWGRTNYEAFCPVCRHMIGKNGGETQIVAFPLVGGPSSGKTTFLMSSIQELTTSIAKEHKWKPSFPYKEDLEYARKMTRLFQNGITPEKTNERTPDAFCIDYQGRGLAESKRLCLYDPAGELFVADHNQLEKQGYYYFMAGLIFIIDPFALRKVKEKRLFQRQRSVENLLVCEEDQEKCLNRLLTALQSKKLIDPTNQNQSVSNFEQKFPCAVVITKADALELTNYETEVTRFAKQNPDLKKAASSYVCRNWLVNQGEGNLVNMIEAEFGKCRYFFVSSLGKRSSSTTRAFQPIGIEEPYRWLLDVANVKGRMGKWGIVTFLFFVVIVPLSITAFFVVRECL